MAESMNSIYRFRLSSLLIAVTIVAVTVGWYINRSWQPSYKVMHLGGSQAMAPTITREILAVDVNAYRRAVPLRWDTVVLNPREQPGGAYVADVLRVVGLPGETISFSNGKLFVDGKPLTLPEQIHHLTFRCDLTNSDFVVHPYTVPAGHYYLLGDNPDAVTDSRTSGAFPRSDIRGRVSGR